jgi:hypothetical protein
MSYALLNARCNRWTSLGIGLVGALIGGAIFRLFGIWPALDSVRHLPSRFAGRLHRLAALFIARLDG